MLLTKGQNVEAARQVPSPHLTCPEGQGKTGRQSSAEATHLPSAQGTRPEGWEKQRRRSEAGRREGQKVMEEEHWPSKHLIGASFGQTATEQLPFRGLMHSKLVQRRGFSGGQPIALGQENWQDPSGQRSLP